MKFGRGWMCVTWVVLRSYGAISRGRGLYLALAPVADKEERTRRIARVLLGDGLKKENKREKRERKKRNGSRR